MHLAHFKAPDLWPPVGLAKETDSQVRWLNTAVTALRYHVEKYAGALELYRFSRSKPANVKKDLAWDWQWIAINEAAFQIWFLREAMDILRNNTVPACSFVASRVDVGAMGRAIDLFDTVFPEFKKMRNAIAHTPGLELAAQKKAPRDGLYAGPQLKNGDCFELVNDGIRYRLNMTTQTLEQLSDVLVTYWSAFSPLEREFDKLGRAE